MKLFGFMDPGARSLDETALLQRCERNIPGTDGNGRSRARHAVRTYRTVRSARSEPVEPPDLWFAIESDRAFRYPAMRLAELQARHQEHTYAYLFTWASPFMGGTLGACHALELPFVFGTLGDSLLANFVGEGPAVQALAAYMQDAWIGFAHGSAPRNDWQPYDPRCRATMVLGAECQVVEAPREEERQFWEFWNGIL
jgi:para-nitrobenzyl esterase